MVAPRYVSDPELAGYPVIVVATWKSTPWRRHEKWSDDGYGIERWEAYTRLNILSVLRGNVEPGEVELLKSPGIAWPADGSWVTSGTSTEMVGDVRDITKPCLWFLKRERSWDEELKEEFLSVSNYREIQPLELYEFYLALSQPDAELVVPTLLSADHDLVSERVLLYLSGGQWPWPFIGYPFDRRQAYQEPLRAEAGRVWDYLQANVMERRSLAASVYAELADEDDVENVRTLLDDRDSHVRAIAVGALARYGDDVSNSRFAKAVEGYDDGIACAVVDAIASWTTPLVVPALIEFLQTDNWTQLGVNTIEMPAIKAQQALKEITGHVFPFDVPLSKKAWHNATRTDDPAERSRILAETAPADEIPLIASAVGTPKNEISDDLKKRSWLGEGNHLAVTIRLLNISSHAVTVVRFPSGEIRSSRCGYAGFGDSWGRTAARCGFGDATFEKQQFTTLAPGASTEFDVVLPQSFLMDSPHKRRLRLLYLDSGKDQGLKAWLGSLDVQFGVDWSPNQEDKAFATDEDNLDPDWPDIH